MTSNYPSKFSQKHYEFLSNFLHYELDVAIEVQGCNTSIETSARVNTIRGLIRLLSASLANDNPRFNAQLFYKACGLGVN